jgi:hypothetical protein
MAIQVSSTPFNHLRTIVHPVNISISHSRGHVFSPQILCHELGCLPVSKLCGLPGPADLLESSGAPKDPEHRMLQQLPELLDQLEWMAVAMKSQR